MNYTVVGGVASLFTGAIALLGLLIRSLAAANKEAREEAAALRRRLGHSDAAEQWCTERIMLMAQALVTAQIEVPSIVWLPQRPDTGGDDAAQ